MDCVQLELYTNNFWGYIIEEKLHSGICKQKMLNTIVLDNQLTDNSGVRLSLNPPKDHCTLFYLRLSWSQGHSVAGRIRPIEKSNDLSVRS
jgi:hypothetical protein